MNQSKVEISVENFIHYLEFLKTSNIMEVNIIGGEPTLHSKFELLLKLIVDFGFRYVKIFTNGIFDQSVLDILTKYQLELVMLFNLNEHHIIGQKAFDKISYNVSKLLEVKKNIVMGINIYKPYMDISYFKKFVLDHSISKIRWSVAVPGKKVSDTWAFYREYIDIVMEFLGWAFTHNIKTSCDCNRIPSCIFSDSHLRLLSIYEPDIFTMTKCTPVVDVKPNLDVIRCFATGHMYSTNLRGYNSFKTLYMDLLRHVDFAIQYKIDEYDNNCTSCLLHQHKKCRSACISML